jgi:hypothetical protein
MVDELLVTTFCTPNWQNTNGETTWITDVYANWGLVKDASTFLLRAVPCQATDRNIRLYTRFRTILETRIVVLTQQNRWF